MSDFIDRTLWYQEGRERATLGQRDLAAISAPIVVLGEAGMGKTRLLECLAEQPDHAWCTARQLINRPEPRLLLGDATTLVVDALDEVASKREGDAVDLVLQKLGALGYPRFVLSCRVADWRQTTSIAAIRDHYALPRELHLEPFDEADARRFLTERLSAQRASEVIDHFNQYGLGGFLGNPQTLEMIERVAPEGTLPRTSSELFDRTVEVIWKEHRDDRAVAELPRARTLDAAGAAFAALLLTGGEAIARAASANLAEGELALPEVEAFDSGDVEKVFATRLFRGAGSDRFTYWHRRIGEYLGARWLAARANTRGKRRRLLAMLQCDGIVPASLRGLHAWLALDPAFAPDIIAADPMGVIEYGDADMLTSEQAQAMTAALCRLAEDNPRFREYGPYRAQGLVQPALLAEVRALITDPGTPFGVKLLLLQQLERADIAVDLAAELRAIALNAENSVTERGSAIDALVAFGAGTDWSDLAEALRALGDADSTRLAFELLEMAGYASFSDVVIVELIVAHAGLSVVPARREPGSRRERTIGAFSRLKREIPLDRIEGVLDLLTQYLEALVERRAQPPGELSDLVLHLTARIVAANVMAPAIAPGKVWHWLRAARDDHGYDRRARETLEAGLQADDRLRRAIQRLVLIDADNDDNMSQRAWRLSRRSRALFPKTPDLVTLLESLDPLDRTDERWRDLVGLTRHDGAEGADVRAAAAPFAAHRSDLVRWLEQLADPEPAQWEVRRDRSDRRHKARQAAAWAEHRRQALAHIEEMRRGEYASVVNPATSYLKRFRDMGDCLPAHERVAEWLGPEVAEAAHAGFEAFLLARPPVPNAVQLAHAMAESRSWDGALIIVAALAERHRLGLGFADLKAERVIAGWLEMCNRSYDDAGIEALGEALAQEIRRRGRMRSALVLLIEPQLQAGCPHVVRLYELMRQEDDAALALELAPGWLARFPMMSEHAESELIGRVIGSPRAAELVATARARLAESDLAPERRRSWQAVELIVDFEGALVRLGENDVEPDLLWDLREHLGARRRDGGSPRTSLTPRQIGWIVSRFRSLWPHRQHPGSSQGDDNPWDATEFITTLIGILGDDVGDEAIAVMAELRVCKDGYHDTIRIIASEQRRKLAETRYRPPSLGAVAVALEEGPPSSAADLQAVMLEALEVAQSRLKGDRIDWYKGFFTDAGDHKDEESCRDELMKLLDGKVGHVELRPESHLADDKRVDIEASAGQALMVPVEIKGQWHKALWTAADSQLDTFYGSDWRADRRGIYLVLWFGPTVPLTPPDGGPAPETPEELRAALTAASAVCRSGLVRVVVLDLTRP